MVLRWGESMRSRGEAAVFIATSPAPTTRKPTMDGDCDECSSSMWSVLGMIVVPRTYVAIWLGDVPPCGEVATMWGNACVSRVPLLEAKTSSSRGDVENACAAWSTDGGVVREGERE